MLVDYSTDRLGSVTMLAGSDGSVRNTYSYRQEWRNATPDQIYRAAAGGNGRARTAKKLLDSREYDK